MGVVEANLDQEQDKVITPTVTPADYISFFVFVGSIILTVRILFHLSLLMLHLFHFLVDHRHIFV